MFDDGIPDWGYPEIFLFSPDESRYGTSTQLEQLLSSFIFQDKL